MQYSEVISAKASDNGNCYLKIVAHYGNEHKESYHTVQRYMTEDSDEERSNIVIVVVVALVDFALILTAVVYLIYFHHKEKLSDQLKKETLTERNEEEKMLANDEANDMFVNEPTENDHSLDQVVPEIEGAKDL
ncbi:uncharacterized protein LOC132754332 [Ruditapes philippinarum]|uniref:uncharacterized protein LOC132754332 n=1 Tax=Ruditapes philippinarum TaxID=129788 RepID=UPI00295AE371|nr:uncharacterized protein LOC132754332 [Ruditapes philippinarum]